MSSAEQYDGRGSRSLVGRETNEDILALGRGAPLPKAELVPVYVAVAAAASENPTATAVRCGDVQVSYEELLAWAEVVADELLIYGMGRGTRVAVLVEPSLAMVAAVLGVLRAGAAFVPIEHTQPDHCIARIVRDASISAVLVTEQTASQIDGLDTVAVSVDDIPDASEQRRSLNCEMAQLEDPAYMIYTSGTTGEPKGVVVDHAQLAASTLARRLVYPGAGIFLLVSPLAFDSSAAGLWGTLTSGGTLVVARSDEVRDPEQLMYVIDRYGVTQLLCVPSLYRAILDAAERSAGTPFGSLDVVIVAGEQLDEVLVDRHFALLSDGVALVNEYGPTEATVWATYHRFNAPGPVSIGGPIPGALLYVLDDDQSLVPRGVEGELFIGGAGVALGYFERPEATAQVFMPDPFVADSAALMYRTGDLVRWTDAGLLEFIGRRDQQVKIRGHRVELGAVEAALRALPDVQDAVVVPSHCSTRLIGFVQGSPSQSPNSMREQLARTLPAVMVPSTVEVIDTFPRTLSGKVDRTGLRTRAEGDAVLVVESDKAHVPDNPANMTACVGAAWKEVLQASRVPTDVNFFDLGGHSLAMFELQEALERHTGVRPSVVSLFQHTTVASQASLISGGRDVAGDGRDREAAVERVRALRERRATRDAIV